MAEPLKQLGQNIKQARKSKGLTQKQLAKSVNLYNCTLCMVELGKANISFIYLVKIANVLETNLQNLLSGI